ncbi:hypothetical protein C2142_20230 [Streptomyces sp. CB01881]|nr:hypothetical protein C2142_20230 [Streptomyces sp. CB01881]
MPTPSSRVTVAATTSGCGAVVEPSRAVERCSTRKTAVRKVPASSRLPSAAEPFEGSAPPSAPAGARVFPSTVQPGKSVRLTRVGAAGEPPVRVSRAAVPVAPSFPAAIPASPLRCSRGFRTGREKPI